MNTLCNIITTMAAFMFMLGMCMIDGNPVLALSMMFVSGIVIAAFGYAYEEKRRKRMSR